MQVEKGTTDDEMVRETLLYLITSDISWLLVLETIKV